ncbi:MAG: cytochrome c3 family protein [Desulfovibrionaceae bacterium]|nr:cytochrome c3 family protein [Desulfovibrionaceae bacterium]
MPKRYIPAAILTLALLATGVAGYLVPDENQKVPVRILFDNSGGKVVFAHLTHHRKYQIACARCHHESGQDQTPLPCGSCHPASFDQDYVRDHVAAFPDQKSCVKCHHAEFGELAFDHQAHKAYAGDDCRACHHGPDIEPEPGHCKDCHTLTGDGNMPNLRDASHRRCAECHKDMFDKGVKGCSPCHRMKDMKGYQGPFTPCRQCHQAPNHQLILNRTNAFHDQCMQCHKKEGKGPRTDKDCGECHMR